MYMGPGDEYVQNYSYMYFVYLGWRSFELQVSEESIGRSRTTCEEKRSVRDLKSYHYLDHNLFLSSWATSVSVVAGWGNKCKINFA